MCVVVQCQERPIRTQGGADSGHRLEPYIKHTVCGLEARRKNTLTFSHNIRGTNAHML